MPTVPTVSGFRFFFYNLEGTEPPHIPTEHGRNTVKHWLDPVQLAGSRGFRAHELNRVRALVPRLGDHASLDVQGGME